MKKFTLILLTMLAFLQVSFGQDVVQMMNGKEKKVMYDSLGTTHVYFHKKEGGRSHKLKKEDVFRVFLKKGDTVYAYVQDTITNDEEYTLAEMERVINGRIEARKYYHPWLNFAGGVCVGGAGSFLGLFIGFAPPALYATLVGVREANSANFVVSNDALYDDEFFLEGYEIGARIKKIRYAIAGSLTGLVIGSTVLHFTGE